jgi:hypothetical protein
MGQSFVHWQFRSHDTSSTGVLLCMGLDRAHSHDLGLHLFDCTGGCLWSKILGFLSYGGDPMFFF